MTISRIILERYILFQFDKLQVLSEHVPLNDTTANFFSLVSRKKSPFKRIDIVLWLTGNQMKTKVRLILNMTRESRFRINFFMRPTK